MNVFAWFMKRSEYSLWINLVWRWMSCLFSDGLGFSSHTIIQWNRWWKKRTRKQKRWRQNRPTYEWQIHRKPKHWPENEQKNPDQSITVGNLSRQLRILLYLPQKCQKVKLFIHRLYFKMKFAVHLSLFFAQRKMSKVRKQKTKLMSLKRNWTFTLNPMPVSMLLLSHRVHLIAAFRIAFLLFTPNTFIITARKSATQPRTSV